MTPPRSICTTTLCLQSTRNAKGGWLLSAFRKVAAKVNPSSATTASDDFSAQHMCLECQPLGNFLHEITSIQCTACSQSYNLASQLTSLHGQLLVVRSVLNCELFGGRSGCRHEEAVRGANGQTVIPPQPGRGPSPTERGRDPSDGGGDRDGKGGLLHDKPTREP